MSEINSVREIKAALIEQGVPFYGTSAGVVGLANFENTPGASKAMIGWLILNHKSVIDKILDYVPNKYVSADVSYAYAIQADLLAAASLIEKHDVSRIVGVGITASIASDYEKRSKDEAYIYIYSRVRDLVCGHVIFGDNKGEFDNQTRRALESQFISEYALWLLAKHTRLDVPDSPLELIGLIAPAYIELELDHEIT